MPAYYSISILFERADIYPTFVKDFYQSLDCAGLKFKSGYWGFENDTYQEITEWNQNLLEKNFELGYTEHHSHDYKQVVFNYNGYSEVRGFWMNFPKRGEFIFEIIIPEDEVLMWKGDISLEDGSSIEGYGTFINEKIKEWLEFSKKIWLFAPVKVIQTGLEEDDVLISLAAMKNGTLPSLRPFAILKESCCSYIDISIYTSEKIQKEGRFIINNTKEVRY